ncbi:hypothetical protein B5X24_HaOG200757 [Helicoverpa armigera]|nr:hypothetical protein B5X24_HaOG200757 [Helicoverpa armigera]
MIEDKVIKTFVISENIMGVCRNFAALTTSQKIFSIIRIVVEISAYIIIYSLFFLDKCNHVLIEGGHFLSLMMIYHPVNFVCGSMILLCPVYNPCGNKLFIKEFTMVQCEFRHTPFYAQSMKRVKSYIITCITFFSIIVAIVLYTKVLLVFEWSTFGPQSLYIGLITIEIIFEIRQTVESVTIFSYITLLQYHLKTINSCIASVVAQYDPLEARSDSQTNNDHLTVDRVQYWADTYEKISNCSKLLSQCFSTQVNFGLNSILLFIY